MREEKSSFSSNLRALLKCLIPLSLSLTSSLTLSLSVSLFYFPFRPEAEKMVMTLKRTWSESGGGGEVGGEG